jgi:hypothetical protein
MGLFVLYSGRLVDSVEPEPYEHPLRPNIDAGFPLYSPFDFVQLFEGRCSTEGGRMEYMENVPNAEARMNTGDMRNFRDSRGA